MKSFYITLQYVTLHCITWNYNKWNYRFLKMTSYDSEFQYTKWNNTLHCSRSDAILISSHLILRPRSLLSTHLISSHLTSSHVFSPLVRSSQSFSPHLNWFQLYCHILSNVLTSSHPPQYFWSCLTSSFHLILSLQLISTLVISFFLFCLSASCHLLFPLLQLYP